MTIYACPGSAVVGEGGSVEDKGPHPRSGGFQRTLTISYACPVRTGVTRGRTLEVVEAGKKVKLAQIVRK